MYQLAILEVAISKGDAQFSNQIPNRPPPHAMALPGQGGWLAAPWFIAHDARRRHPISGNYFPQVTLFLFVQAEQFQSLESRGYSLLLTLGTLL